MTGNAAYRLRGRPLPNGPAPFTTLVELTWIEKRIECWIRFGQESYEQKLDQPIRVSYLTEQTSHHPPVSAFYVEAPVTNVVRLCFAKQPETIAKGVAGLARARALLAG